MSRVITFSRYYPKGHPKAGQPTFFVEKIWESIYLDHTGSTELDTLDKSVFDVLAHGKYEPKHHTIRAGNRWKAGDTFSPRVWSGKPYASKQIQFAPDIEIKKVWDIAYHSDIFFLHEKIMKPDSVSELAKNDGLMLQDFYDWFSIHPKAIKQITKFQILCWNESIEY